MYVCVERRLWIPWRCLGIPCAESLVEESPTLIDSDSGVTFVNPDFQRSLREDQRAPLQELDRHFGSCSRAGAVIANAVDNMQRAERSRSRWSAERRSPSVQPSRHARRGRRADPHTPFPFIGPSSMPRHTTVMEKSLVNRLWTLLLLPWRNRAGVQTPSPLLVRLRFCHGSWGIQCMRTRMHRALLSV